MTQLQAPAGAECPLCVSDGLMRVFKRERLRQNA